MKLNLLIFFLSFQTNAKTTFEGITNLAQNASFLNLFSECDFLARQTIRAIFHDATSKSVIYNYPTAVDGSILYEMDVLPNRLVSDSIDAILPFATDSVSFSDALILAGKFSLKACNGPSFTFSYGRIDANKAGPPDLLFEDSAMGQDERTLDMGLTKSDLLTLVAGGHSIATIQGEIAFDGTPEIFDNAFVQEMLAPPSHLDLGRVRLVTDRIMAADPDGKRLWGQFAQKESILQAQFAIAFEKLANLGWEGKLTKML
jgi:hypothetical protein